MKQYAKESGQVWYVSGSGADDVITVDYVTEPGLLQGKHLVTRLTNNNGNYSYAAQVNLDFNATDPDGKPAWAPNDSFLILALTGSAAVPPKGRLSGEAQFTLSLDGATGVTVTVPSELGLPESSQNMSIADLVADVNAALVSGGFTDKVEARASGNMVSLVRLGPTTATSSLVVTSVNTAARDDLHFTAGQTALKQNPDTASLSNLLPPEAEYEVILVDALAGDDQIYVGPTVQKTVWIDAGDGDDTVRIASGNAILVDKADLGTRNDTAEAATRVGPESGLPGSVTLQNLTLDNPADEDWFRFTLSAPADASIIADGSSDLDGLTAALYLVNPDGSTSGVGSYATAISADALDSSTHNDTLADAFRFKTRMSITRTPVPSRTWPAFAV